MKQVLLEGFFVDKIKDPDIAEYLKSLDPTKGKALDWLARQYLMDREISNWDYYEGSIRDYLITFYRYSLAKLLRPGEQHLEKDYPTIDSLVKKLHEIESGNREEYIKYLDKQKKKKDINIGYSVMFERWHCDHCDTDIESKEELNSHSCKKTEEELEKELKNKLTRKVTKELKQSDISNFVDLESADRNKVIDLLKTVNIDIKPYYTIKELTERGFIKPILEVGKLNSFEAVQEKCQLTTWCIKNSKQFNHYKNNLGCNFYLVVNRQAKGETPCSLFLIVVHPSWYLEMLTVVKQNLYALKRNKNTIKDEVFSAKFNKLEKYIDLVDSVYNKRDEVLFLVYNADNRIITFSTFLDAFNLEKLRGSFQIPKTEYSSSLMVKMQHEDAEYAAFTRVHVREFKIKEEVGREEVNDIEKIADHEYSEKDRKKLDMLLTSGIPNMPKVKILNEIVFSEDKKDYRSHEKLDTDVYCDHGNLRYYRKFDYVKITEPNEYFDIYINEPHDVPFQTLFFLISKEDPKHFFFVRYNSTGNYSNATYWEMLKMVEAAYVDAEIDDKLAYFCYED